MSLRFSRVTLYSEGTNTSFLVGGIPQKESDLEVWTGYRDFINIIPGYKRIKVWVATFLYGGEEPVDATPEEVAYIYERIKMRKDFIDTRTRKIGETDFEIIRRDKQ